LHFRENAIIDTIVELKNKDNLEKITINKSRNTERLIEVNTIVIS
jgi:hypothetical protein